MNHVHLNAFIWLIRLLRAIQKEELVVAVALGADIV